MSIDYHAVNGDMETVNVSGNKFLGKITAFVWDKIGIPDILTDEETKLIARLLRNYIKLQKVTMSDEKDMQYYFWNQLGYEQEQQGELIWVEQIAKFFDESGGLMDEEKWHKKYGE